MLRQRRSLKSSGGSCGAPASCIMAAPAKAAQRQRTRRTQVEVIPPIMRWSRWERQAKPGGGRFGFGGRLRAELPNDTSFPRLGILHRVRQADEGVGRGPGGPPHDLCRIEPLGKVSSVEAELPAPQAMV